MKRRSAPMPVTQRPVVAAPPPVFTQAQQRERRRLHLRVVYGKDFDLAAEVDGILGPIAKQVAADPRPTGHRGEVDDVADAVHALVSACVGLIAERQGVAKVKHLADRPGDRTKALRTIGDLAPRPAAPTIQAQRLSSGTWAEVLVDLARPYAAPLAVVLGGALPPDHDGLKGSPSTSERLEAELRELDRAASALRTRVEKAAFYRRECPTPVAVDRRTQEAHAKLAELGVSL